jgi:hypothetical protein
MRAGERAGRTYIWSGGGAAWGICSAFGGNSQENLLDRSFTRRLVPCGCKHS